VCYQRDAAGQVPHPDSGPESVLQLLQPYPGEAMLRKFNSSKPLKTGVYRACAVTCVVVEMPCSRSGAGIRRLHWVLATAARRLSWSEGCCSGVGVFELLKSGVTRSSGSFSDEDEATVAGVTCAQRHCLVKLAPGTAAWCNLH
jgi:hypothetical protein